MVAKLEQEDNPRVGFPLMFTSLPSKLRIFRQRYCSNFTGQAVFHVS